MNFTFPFSFPRCLVSLHLSLAKSLVMMRATVLTTGCYIGKQLKEWSNWITMVKWCYNTIDDSSIVVSPFEALCGYSPPKLLTYIHGTTTNVAVNQHLKSREQLLSILQENLQKAQHRIKLFADRKGAE